MTKIEKMIRPLLAGALLSSIGQAALSETLYVAGPGGVLEERFKTIVIPPFEKLHNVTVRYVAAQSTEIVAKLEAQRSNQDFDVVSLTDGVMLQAEQRGLCAPLKDDPVYAELIPGARLTKNSISWMSVGTVIAINEKVFAKKGWPEPVSWLDLGKSQYAGELAMLSVGSSTTGIHGLVMVARANGGGEANIDPGFQYFKSQVKPNLVTVVSSAAKMSEMLQTGEVAIGVTAEVHPAVLKEAGAPLKIVYPKEGAPLALSAFCAVAGSDVPDLAQKFIQYSVSVDGQTGFAKGVRPVNKKIALRSAEQAGTFITLDWATVNEKRDEWINRWNREIER